MSNEHSDILKSNWNINLLSEKRLTVGSAECSVLTTREGTYFLKIYQERYSCNDIEREIAVCYQLNNAGEKTSEFIETNNHTFYTVLPDNRICILQKYIRGRVFGKFTLNHVQMYSSARKLGRLHSLMEQIPWDLLKLPCRFGLKWSMEWDPELDIRKCDAYISQAKTMNNAPAQLIDSLQKKKEVIYKIAENRQDFSGLTFVNSHGDYSVLQLIFDPVDDRKMTVIDFAAASRLPAVWEIIRSYSYADPACAQGTLSFDSLIPYVQSYLSEYTLSKEDIRVMPFLYLENLARSFFGFHEYLKNPRDHKSAELADFAFWRTNAAWWLQSHVSSLSSALVNGI